MNKGNTLSTLQLIHIGLSLAQVLFLTIVLLMIFVADFNFGNRPSEDSLPNSMDQLFQYLVPFLLATGYIIGLLIFRARLRAIVELASFEEKTTAYKGVFVMRLAMMEMPSFVSTIAYFLTQNILFLYLSIGMVILFIFQRPTRDQLAVDLNLSIQEKELL